MPQAADPATALASRVAENSQRFAGFFPANQVHDQTRLLRRHPDKSARCFANHDFLNAQIPRISAAPLLALAHPVLMAALRPA